jgi:hypothetical protein
MAAAISAAPAQERVQLAQAQQPGAHSDTGAGTNQRGNASNRQGGGTTGQASQGGGKGSGGKDSGGKASGSDRASVRSEGTSHTSVREHSEGSRVSVHGGRSHVGVRTAERDSDVIIKHKKARRYVYDEPGVVIKKKRHYVSYGEPSHSVVTKERRGGVAVSGGVSTRTSVHTRSSGSTTVGASSTTRSNGGKGANARSSGQGGGNSGGPTGGSTGQSRGSSGRSGSSGGGEASGQR